MDGRGRLIEQVEALVNGGQVEQAASLASSVWRQWLAAGDVAGGRRLLSLVLDRDDARPSPALARALYADGLLSFRAGLQEESRARNIAALEMARAISDPEAESDALVGLSRVALRDHDYPAVQALARQALELTRDLDPSARANPLHLLAAGTRLAGDYEPALALYTESLELNRSLGDGRGVAMELHNLCHVHLHLGHPEAARTCFEQWLELRTESDPYDAAMAHLDQAALVIAAGDTSAGRNLLDAAISTLERAGVVLDPDDAFEVEWLRARLG